MRLALLVVVFAGAWSQAPQPRPDSLRLPKVALEAADAGPLSTAFVVAQFGVPARVITSADPSSPPFAELASRLTEPRTALASEVVDRLARAQPDYHVAWRDGLLVIEERDLVCGDESRRRTVGPVDVSGDMSRLIVLLGWLAAGGSGPIPAGSMSPTTPTAAEAKRLPAVDLAFAEALSLGEGLDALVRQSRGGAWIIWQHERSDGRTGCRIAGYFPNGYVGASSVDFAVR